MTENGTNGPPYYIDHVMRTRVLCFTYAKYTSRDSYIETVKSARLSTVNSCMTTLLLGSVSLVTEDERVKVVSKLPIGALDLTSILTKTIYGET